MFISDNQSLILNSQDPTLDAHPRHVRSGGCGVGQRMSSLPPLISSFVALSPFSYLEFTIFSKYKRKSMIGRFSTHGNVKVWEWEMGKFRMGCIRRKQANGLVL